MTPEGKVKQAYRALLKERGAYFFSPVQTGLGRRTLDDLICYRGWFIAIEAKAPGGKLTDYQEQTARQIEAAGGRVLRAPALSGIVRLLDWIDREEDA
ncbi:MAG: hypothetical protein C4555_04470 [Dehalococcoidia bacterium]|nr:MAG: hypothetical protein C4555_04470 [Dehalococcoidia bacterium]